MALNRYRGVQLRIDYAKGRAGQVLGPPCNVFRVQDNGATNYLDTANMVAQGVYSARRMNVKTSDIEAPKMGGLFFAILFDTTKYETGDIFVEQDPYYGAGGDIVDYSTDQFEGYCLAYHAPFKRCIAARIDRTCTIYRPVEVPDSTSPGPYWKANLSATTMAPIVLSEGSWTVGEVGATPSQIPVGIQSHARLRSDIFKGLPGSTEETTWFIYVPDLNGFNPQEGDRIVTGGDLTSGTRYVIHHPYQQQAGLQGSQLVCLREIQGGA